MAEDTILPKNDVKFTQSIVRAEPRVSRRPICDLYCCLLEGENVYFKDSLCSNEIYILRVYLCMDAVILFKSRRMSTK